MKITIGQYYPADSVIHKMDARIKLLCIFVFITSLFFVSNFVGYGFAVLFLGFSIRTSKVPFRMMLRGLRALLFILIFTTVLNTFFSPGEIVLFEWGVFRMTQEGLIRAGQMSLRLAMLVMGSQILTLTTTPMQLTDAIEYILRPFRKIGVPYQEIAMMMTIALRFIPTLIEELDKIMKAQKARGASFDTGGLIKKAKAMVPLLVPLFISAFRRADDLALAMESRCYRVGMERTKMRKMKTTRVDYVAMSLMVLFVAGIVGIEVFVAII